MSSIFRNLHAENQVLHSIIFQVFNSSFFQLAIVQLCGPLYCNDRLCKKEKGTILQIMKASEYCCTKSSLAQTETATIFHNRNKYLSERKKVPNKNLLVLTEICNMDVLSQITDLHNILVLSPSALVEAIECKDPERINNGLRDVELGGFGGDLAALCKKARSLLNPHKGQNKLLAVAEADVRTLLEIRGYRCPPALVM